MDNSLFSFIILTFNEEMHLPRLLNSIQGLHAPVFILDSGSSDHTVDIANRFGAIVAYHAFENHPKQWEFALTHFHVTTPWTICLDADQVVLPELYHRLYHFKNEDIPEDVQGIYFNRKNYFKGKWIKHGGYFPKYMLKMFKTGIGYSDTDENMDHRFVVPGKTIIWKDGYIKEENLKENHISYWITKHNRYSDLLAQEEIERKKGLRRYAARRWLHGSPDERIAYQKNIWRSLPLFIRPFLYFFYRYFFRLGFLDGREGLIFHVLQGFWFRFLVDVKIWEFMQSKKSEKSDKQSSLF